MFRFSIIEERVMTIQVDTDDRDEAIKFADEAFRMNKDNDDLICSIGYRFDENYKDSVDLYLDKNGEIIN